MTVFTLPHDLLDHDLFILYYYLLHPRIPCGVHVLSLCTSMLHVFVDCSSCS